MLRDYQQKAVDEVMADPAPDRCCLVAPTGSGKTHIGVAVVDRCACETLWIAHRVELVAQARERLPAHVTVDTIQGLLASGMWPRADLVVLDECHHYASDDWSAILGQYQRARIVGLTATPMRSDGRALGQAFTRLVVASHYSQLIAAGHLVDCDIVRPAEQLERGLAQEPLAAYQQHGDGRRCFAYAGRVELAAQYADEFRRAGIMSAVVDAGTHAEERKTALALFRSGAILVLWSVYVYTEGTDVPDAAVCLLARGCGSVGTYLQMAGRVLRPAPGKERALLIDLPGVSHMFGSPTLDRRYSLEGKAISCKPGAVRQCAQCGHVDDPWVGPCPRCGFDPPPPPVERPRIYSASLGRVYAGAQTPLDARENEWRRLVSFAQGRGWGISWSVKEYKKLFGGPPPATQADRDALYRYYLKTGRPQRQAYAISRRMLP